MSDAVPVEAGVPSLDLATISKPVGLGEHMSTKDASLTERVQTSFRQLSVAATNLNTVSTKLAKAIAELDLALKKLNLGIPAWVTVHDYRCAEPFYKYDQVGYDKIGGSWGIALRTVSGNETCPENDQDQEWLFNDGPRFLRTDAVEKIPELLEKLTKEADATTHKICDKIQKARDFTSAIQAIADQK